MIIDRIETPRLILKTLDETAAGDVLDFYSENPEFAEFEPERPFNFYTNDHMAATLRYESDIIKKQMGLRLWIFAKENPYRIIGTVSFRNVIRGAFGSTQIGYKIHRDVREKGYATEAVRWACDRVFKDFDIHRIEAYTLPDNFPSMRVLAKVGFKEEGTVRDMALIQGAWRNHIQYGLLETDNLGL